MIWLTGWQSPQGTVQFTCVPQLALLIGAQNLCKFFIFYFFKVSHHSGNGKRALKQEGGWSALLFKRLNREWKKYYLKVSRWRQKFWSVFLTASRAWVRNSAFHHTPAEASSCSRGKFSGPGNPQVMLSSPGSAPQTLCIRNSVLRRLEKPEPDILPVFNQLLKNAKLVKKRTATQDFRIKISDNIKFYTFFLEQHSRAKKYFLLKCAGNYLGLYAVISAVCQIPQVWSKC